MKAATQRVMAFGILMLVLGLALSSGFGDSASALSNAAPVYLPLILNEPTPVAARPLVFLGPVGTSTGGTAFVDQPPDNGDVIVVQIRSGQVVDNVQFILSTGALGAHGGGGGDLAQFTLVSGEYIAAINGTAGCVVDQIYFVTNLRTSVAYGSGTGTDDPCGNGTGFSMAAPAGYEIVGLWGSAGALIDHLGVLARVRR